MFEPDGFPVLRGLVYLVPAARLHVRAAGTGDLDALRGLAREDAPRHLGAALSRRDLAVVARLGLLASVGRWWPKSYLRFMRSIAALVHRARGVAT